MKTRGWTLAAIPLALSLMLLAGAASPARAHPARAAAADAKIEIVWPHDPTGRERPVSQAPLANLTAYVFQPQTLAPVPDAFDAPIRLWRAANNEPARPVAVGVKRTASVAGHSIPVWDFNDVDVTPARDPRAKVFFFLSAGGMEARTNIWSHGADGLTYLPTQATPDVRPGWPAEVDAAIQIVWPHDPAGRVRPVTGARLANVTVQLHHAGTGQSVPPDLDFTVRLHRSVNNEPDEEVAVATRRLTAAGYPVWDFNDVDVSEARDARNKIYFRVTVDGVPTFSSIWAHGADARTYFPQPDVPYGSPARAGGAGTDTDHSGFFNVRSGVLVDPSGREFRGIGANLPGVLEYGRTVDFDWLAEHHVRWVRVFATSFEGPHIGDEEAARRLQKLVRQAATADIAVLVAFTNYYTRGAPGDEPAYVQDNPHWCGELNTLAAGWFDPAAERFDSPTTACGTPARLDAPTFRANYLPRVLAVARALRDEPNMLGYQLGNETRPYHRPDLYLAFVQTMLGAIRSIDPNHLVTPGALNVAHVLDYGDPAARDAFAGQLAALPWDFWSATLNDWEQYTLDDLGWAARRHIPILLTELNFCLQPGRTALWQDGEQTRADVVRDGSFGHPGVAELILSTPGLAGAAPWGSAPLVNADMVGGSNECGITNAPDAGEMWAAWSAAGASVSGRDD